MIWTVFLLVVVVGVAYDRWRRGRDKPPTGDSMIRSDTGGSVDWSTSAGVMLMSASSDERSDLHAGDSPLDRMAVGNDGAFGERGASGSWDDSGSNDASADSTTDNSADFSSDFGSDSGSDSGGGTD